MVKNLLGKWVNGASRDSQGGFTLIEMSIVLAIIGLIVGGILKGQEVINNARIKTQVSQIDAIKAAIFTFQDRYGYYPGDIDGTVLGVAGAKFNQNGCVDAGAAGSCTPIADNTDSAQNNEMQWQWNEVNAASLIAGVQNNSNGYGVLKGKLTSSYLAFATFSNALGGLPSTGVEIRLQGAQPGAAGTLGSGSALMAADALGIDTKYDDGIPTSGAITVPSYVSAATCAEIAPQVNGGVTTPATNKYIGGATNAATCDLLFTLQ